jgi:hypothetical protein
LSFRTLTTDNIFIHDHKVKLLRSKNLATSQELNVVKFFLSIAKKIPSQGLVKIRSITI